MNIFKWFSKKNEEPEMVRKNNNYLPKSLFVEETEDTPVSQTNNNNMDLFTPMNELHDPNKTIQIREELDEFLNKDFGPQGYEDALVNPDSSNANAHKEILRYQLEIIIERVLTRFENEIANFNFHLITREKNGMFDIAEEIKAEVKKYEEEILKIKAIASEAKENKGKGQIILLSYDQGFKKGLAAITASQLFGKKLENE